MARSPKKSEMIEVRLSYAAKAAFQERCQAQGRTVSEVVRGFIDDELSPSPPRAPFRGWRLIAAAAAGLVVGGIAAPSLAHPSADHASCAALQRPAALR